jgi:hypothetical protein
MADPDKQHRDLEDSTEDAMLPLVLQRIVSTPNVFKGQKSPEA